MWRPPAAARGAPPLRPVSGGQRSPHFYRARGGTAAVACARGYRGAIRLLPACSTAPSVDGLDPESYQPPRSPRAGGPRGAAASGADPARRADCSARRSSLMPATCGDRRHRHCLCRPRAASRPALAARHLLEAAAAAPSLADFVSRTGWMNPIYAHFARRCSTAPMPAIQRTDAPSSISSAPAPCRLATALHRRQRRRPAAAVRARARWSISMRVVVGKPKYPTPMMTALSASLRSIPYWNVPPDLAAERIAPVRRQAGRPLPAEPRAMSAVRLDRPGDGHRPGDGRLEGRGGRAPSKFASASFRGRTIRWAG